MPEGRAVGEDFLHKGAKVLHLVVGLRASADEVWSDLTSPDGFDYIPGLKVRWTSPQPFGVGTTRSVKVGSTPPVDERYFLWDDAARRKAFYVERFRAPGLHALAEDYKVVSDGPGSVFTWRVVIDPLPHLRLLAFFLRPVLGLALKRIFIKRFGAPVR